VAVRVVSVGSEGRQVELVHHVKDEPGEVALGESVAQVWGEQEGLVAVAAQEVVGHGSSYPFAPLALNVLVLKSHRRHCGFSVPAHGRAITPVAGSIRSTLPYRVAAPLAAGGAFSFL
jgi:hypothetical protein